MTYIKTYSFRQTVFLSVLLSVILAGCYSPKLIRKRFISYTRPAVYPIRTDGYYYHISTDTSCHNAYRYFFFANGKMLDAGDTDADSMVAAESKFTAGYFDFVLTQKVTGGYTNYRITADSIAFETVGIWQGYPHFIYSGRILSDTAFLITGYRQDKERWRHPLNDTFLFRQFVLPAGIKEKYLK